MESQFATFFLYAQIVILSVLLYLAWKLFYQDKKTSFFKLKEADRLKNQKTSLNPTTAAKAKHSSQERPAVKRLSGIRLNAPPHEILGVPPSASKKEILKAYKALMKRFHPDILGSTGSQAWKEAQKFTIAIQNAKDEMLKRL